MQLTLFAPELPAEPPMINNLTPRAPRCPLARPCLTHSIGGQPADFSLEARVRRSIDIIQGRLAA